MNSEKVLKIWLDFVHPEEPRKHRWIASALIWCLAAVAIHSLQFWLMQNVTSVIHLAVIGVSLFYGPVPGFATAAVLSLYRDYFFIEPVGSVLTNAEGITRMLMAMVFAGIVGAVVASLRHALILANASMRKAEQFADALDKTISFVAHDIRNPLSSAKVNAEFLTRFKGNRERDEKAVHSIIASLNRANRMIEDLLDAQAIRSGSPIQMRFEEIDLRRMADSLFADLNTRYQGRFELQSDPVISGYWSVDNLRRAVENLAVNAVKFGNSESKIMLGFHGTPETLKISVHNFGVPIAPEVLSGLFEPFYSEKVGPSQGVPKGWGLGLTITRGVCEAHGGKILVESTAEKGTTFTMMLPRDLRKSAIARLMDRSDRLHQ